MGRGHLTVKESQGKSDTAPRFVAQIFFLSDSRDEHFSTKSRALFIEDRKLFNFLQSPLPEYVGTRNRTVYLYIYTHTDVGILWLHRRADIINLVNFDFICKISTLLIKF